MIDGERNWYGVMICVDVKVKLCTIITANTMISGGKEQHKSKVMFREEISEPFD